MSKEDKLEAVYTVHWPDGKIWSDSVSKSYEGAQIRIITFFLPEAVVRHVTRWEADIMWKAYEKAGFTIKRYELAGNVE